MVKIEYYLVCPGDEPPYRWQMARGLGKNVRANAPPVNALCIRIPDASRLSTPGSRARPDSGQVLIRG